MKNQVHVACAADDSYVTHLGVMLYSLFENNSASFHIHLLSSSFSESNTETIHNLCDKFSHEFTMHRIDAGLFKDFYTSKHITIATYYRILLPEILDQSLDKVIYLDSDMVIVGNIEPLWEIDIDNKALAAVSEPSFNDYERLSLPVKHGYFNAGVLVINIKYWRAKQATVQLKRYIIANAQKLNFWDQDALNACFNEEWITLKPKYNQQGSFFCIPRKKLLNTYTKSDLNEALVNPVIIHYTGSVKPWHDFDYNPNRSVYIKYLNEYSNFSSQYFFKEHSLPKRIKRILLYITTPYFKKRLIDFFVR
jgi:lipopolysaccharide biosynthesis glycosyltransferase